MNKYEVRMGYNDNSGVEVEADLYLSIKRDNPHNHRMMGVYVFLVGDEIFAEFPCSEVKMIKKVI